MTLSTSTASQTFPGNGVTQIFPCGFRIFQASDISVSLVNAVTGISTPLALNSDYTLTGEGDQTGFTLSTSVPVATGTNLLVARNIAYTQPTDFTNQGSFFPTMHEDCADRLGMQIQQLAGGIQRTLQLPDGIYPVASGTLPYPSPLAPLVWNAAGNGLANGSTAMTGDMLLRGNLASTSSGNGASLIGFIQSGIGSVARTLQAWMRERPISAKDFGAVGDGVANDASALANFALACAGRKGFIPAGTYLCNSPVTFGANCIIGGSGVGSTVLKQGAGMSSASAFILLGTTNCTLQDLTVDGNYSNNTGFGNASVQSVNGSSGCVVRNVSFTNWGFQALALYGDAVVDGCFFKGSGSTTIKPAQYGIWYDTAASRVNISNCLFSQISTNAIIGGGVSTITGCVFKGHGSYSGTQSGAIYTSNTTISCTVHNNIFLADGGFGCGIENNYGNNTITGNFITSQTAGGVTLEGTGSASVTGNIITGCFDGVDVKPGASNFTVTGNELYGNTHAQINIEVGSSNNFSITGNMLAGTTKLLDASSGTTKNITNNVGYNPIGGSGTGIAVTASPFSYTNNFGCPIYVVILNGTLSSVTVSGWSVGQAGTNTGYLVPHGKTITVTYSSAPSMLYLGL